MLELKDVHYTPNGMAILRGVDLVIEKHAIFVVMGASGAGKSTILRLMNGLIKPHSGSVLVDGEDIVKLSEKRLTAIRRRVGMVFQNSALFDSLTVAENVGFAWRKMGLGEEAFMERVRQTLGVVGLRDIEDRMPADLSGGMRKRVGLARAIAMEPEALLYDEPTSGLDPVSSQTILDLIVDLRTRLQVTSVVVTHDPAGALAIADQIALLDDGVIGFVGSTDAFREASSPLVRRFLSGVAGPTSLREMG